MSKVGMWNGVDSGASRVENEDRKAQNANYSFAAQKFNVMAAFGKSSSGPSPGL